MSKAAILRKVLFLIFFLLVTACRKDEVPTPTSTPQPIDDEVVVTKAPEPSATPKPTEEIIIEESIVYDWAPKLIGQIPAAGEEAGLSDPITIRFDQPMDQSSVLDSFALTGQANSQVIEGDFQWPSADTVVFTPDTQLDRGQLYTVRVSQSASGENGEVLEAPAEFQLQTVGFLEVSQVIPEGNSSGIDTDTAIIVAFNRPVAPLVSTQQAANLPDPLHLEPAAQGQGEWLSTSIYRFTPDQPLAGASQYAVRVPAGLTDVTGGELTEAYGWTFTTMDPEIVAFSVENDASGIGPTDSISVTFNMPMDQISSESAISLSPSTPLDFNWTDDSRSLTMTADAGLALDSSYELSIGTGAQSAIGSASLNIPESINFTTVPYPRILGTDPLNGRETQQFQSSARVDFASPMELDSFRNQITITPEQEEPNLFLTAEGTRLIIGLDLTPNSEYEITIPASAADPYGNTLGADYTWRFRTPLSSPLVSLNLPFRVSQLSTSHPSDIEVIHRNVSRVDVELYAVENVEDAIIYSNLSEFVPRYRPIRSWSVPVEFSPEQVGTVPISLADGQPLDPGFYFLQVSAPEIKEEQLWWQNQINLLTVADSNLVVKEMFGAVHSWATDLSSGEPISDLPLTLFDGIGQQLGTAVTDENGLASFPYQPADDRLQGVMVMSHQPGSTGFGAASSTWNEGVSPWEFGVSSSWHRDGDRFGYLYSDRPIYRPGDTVHFKGIVRDRNFGRYPLPSRDDVSLGLTFISDYETTDWDFSATLDENGEFSGEYQIPEDARLGAYRLSFKDSPVEGYLDYTIAEYRAPEFLVTTTAVDDALHRGDSVDVLTEAEFFFGGSASDLELGWSAYERPFLYPWDGPYYNFGDRAGYFQDSDYPFNFFTEEYLGNYILGGQGFTDSQGKHLIHLPPDLLDESPRGSRIVTVESTILGDSNIPISGRTSIVFHESDIYVGVVASEYIGRAGSDVNIDLITVGWEGETAANEEVDIVYYHREWTPIQAEEFSGRVTIWEAEDTEVGRSSVVTDENGKAAASFSPSTGGTYLAVAEVEDDLGRSQISSANIWVADSAFIGWRHDPDNRRMDLVPDRQDYRPGESANVLVQSPFSGPVYAWLTVERGDQLDSQIVVLRSNSDVLEIPIVEKYSPNAFVSVAAIRGIDEDNPFADMRIGVAELTIVPENLSLNVEITSNDELFSPGDRATFDILVTDHQGNPVQANFSLALVDLAVLTLLPDNAEDIVEAFYHQQSMRSQTGSGLIISGEGLAVEIPIQELGRGGGGGGGEQRSLSAALTDEDDARVDFPDTAYWEAKVVTDSSGMATVEIPLPDSLTTWRLSSKAISNSAAGNETLVGQTSDDVVVTLPLLIQPITPRFFTVGDELEVGAVVHNNTGDSQEIEVLLEADGLSLSGPVVQIVSVEDGERVEISWPVSVDDVEFADLTFRAQSGEYQDATKPTFGIDPDQLIPVVRYTGEDFVGTSGVLEDEERSVEALILPAGADERQGSVQVQLDPSLGAALIEVLESVNDNYDRPVCAHVIADRLLPNAAASQAFQRLDLNRNITTSDLNNHISQDLERLADLQKDDGGWGWCHSSNSSQYLSAYTLLSVAKGLQAGQLADVNMVESASNYLLGQLEPADSLLDSEAANRQAFYLYVLAEIGEADPGLMQTLYSETRHLLDPHAKGLLLMGLGLAGSGGGDVRLLLADLNADAILSSTGAYWEDKSLDYSNLSSDIRGTAMVLAALSMVDPENVTAPSVVRWLMSARTANNWSTGQQTAWTIIALTEWMAASRELEANYEYALAVNREEAVTGRFTLESIADHKLISVPVSELSQSDINFFDLHKGPGGGRLYYTIHLDSFIDAGDLAPVNRGVFIDRQYFDAECDPDIEECLPIDEIGAGQQIRVDLTVIAPNDLVFVIIEDPIPSGTEAQDPGLETSAAGSGLKFQNRDTMFQYGYWGWWHFNNVEFRDDRVVILSDFLPAGTYQYSYTLQSIHPGKFQVPPTTARQEFFPEVFGRSSGMLFEIKP